jgi:hypothetical protein
MGALELIMSFICVWIVCSCV